MFSITIVAAAALVPSVLAHGGVLSYGFEGIVYQGFSPYNSPSGQTTIQRRWDSYNPILDATDATLACNNDGSSLPVGQQKTATISAGSPITAYWNQVWPHPQGPQLTYLARCPGTTCDGVNSNTLKWFKIDESGLLSGTIANGQWAAGKMIQQNSTWTSTIPKSVPSGPYLIRFETIALHSLPAQFYPECAQLNIINGGALEPTASELVLFPGGYSNSDPGLSIVIYGETTNTKYVIPGPALYAGARSGSSPVPGTTTSARPATTSSTARPATSSTSTRLVTSSSAIIIFPSATSRAAPTPTAGGAVANQYAQCGGTGFAGPTVCVTPFKCVALNPYYSQCQ